MEALGINFGLLIVQIIAFFIVLLTLTAWVYKPMLNMMETRKQKIAQGLEDARVAAEARADAQKDADKIRAEAQVEASKIVGEATERAAAAANDVKAAAEADIAMLLLPKPSSSGIAFSETCVVRLQHSRLPPRINWSARRWMKRSNALCSMNSSPA